MHSASRGGNRRRGSAARDRGCYLPREVFFGRLGFAVAFFTAWASDFDSNRSRNGGLVDE